MEKPASDKTSANRRKFLKTLGAAGASTAILPISASANVAGSDRIRVGIVGTGGRGSGAVLENLLANKSAVLTAAGDVFESRLQGNGPRKAGGLQRIKEGITKYGLENQIDLPEERQFTGFDAYKNVIDNCDVVLLTTTPGFRPLHFEHAINAGKHVFMEKPVCVDAKGYNRIIKNAKIADEKGLKVVVGLQRHYDETYLQAFEKVHKEGMIGEPISAQCYWIGARPWNVARQDDWTELEYQMHNWYHFTYLSGDHIAEQHVHNIDVANWFMTGNSTTGGHPISAQGMGGRTGWEDPKTSQIFDHHYVEFRYPDGRILNSQCRHIRGTYRRVGEEIMGAEGILTLGDGKITDYSGKTIWRYRAPRDQKAVSTTQLEHNKLYEAILGKKELNNAYYGGHSSFTAVLGSLASYTGQQVNWDDAVNSDFSLIPDDLSWESAAPVQPQADGIYPAPMPGKTKLPWA